MKEQKKKETERRESMTKGNSIKNNKKTTQRE
jgi:hypothetical protein